jgi:hypothetical protein
MWQEADGQLGELFYIRTDPATNELPTSQLHDYIRTAFQ